VLADSLKSLYGNVNNIDAWVGILAEDHLPGTSVGKTIHEILRVQFEKLRDGDFYFYLNDPFIPFHVKNRIKNTRFSDVLKRNTSLTNLQDNVFFTEECPADSTAATAARVKAVQNITKEGRFVLFPNPANNIINIDMGNAEAAGTIKIFTTDGLLMKTVTAHGNHLQVNIGGFAKGMYILMITSGSETKSFKFMKL